MLRLQAAIIRVLGMQAILMRGLQSHAMHPSARLSGGGAAVAFHPQLPSTFLPLHRLGEQRFRPISHSFRRHTTTSMSALKPGKYALIDSGNYRRLERFDGTLVDRPCPAAEWRPGCEKSVWGGAEIWYELSAEKQKPGGAKGEWKHDVDVPAAWALDFEESKVQLTLSLSEQGQVGVFPEQRDNWAWIRRTIQGAGAQLSADKIKVLNGFAYTGGSTIAAAAADSRVEVVHLDGSTPAVKWARANAAHAKLPETSVRWLCEDCTTFVSRELKRGNTYHALIFDPPAFGRGGKGKVWKLDTDMPKLVGAFAQLLHDEPLLVLLSCHDPAWPSHRLRALLEDALPPSLLAQGRLEAGEMKIDAEEGAGGRALPSGSFVRWARCP